MFDYPALLALSEILRRGSFEAAAQALSVTPSAISQRIRGLEDRLGTAVIDRGPPLRGTPAGLRLAAHLDQVRLLEGALAGPGGDAPPVIRIAVNADSLATWAMAPMRAAPGLIDLVIDDQDHAQGWLRSGLVAAAITGEGRPVGGCDSHGLGAMRYRATASPDFAARHFAGGIDPDSLARAPALVFNGKDALQDRWVRRVTGRRIALPQHRIPSTHAFAEAARVGLGWGMNPEGLVAADLAAGRLVDLAPHLPLDVPLFLQTARITAGAIAPLTRALTIAARAALRPAGPAGDAG
ncbi:LysR family transcriptional regulator ArgP [Paracoccus spongiarum]|uniref:LysR family transcriptional regulator ArgP n=1 Tax=Paracoccus spongiarum TaxID=3064387 RepID=A0ABT9J9K2_9RHOB|nr:LysR family transcriptional regulator ArgP [Paracoccus sp. 2205BS29-5]MDP5306498.1 LysR family transcriptional regulator ArgP [Paracoccus sp. 2205BS29-5]